MEEVRRKSDSDTFLLALLNCTLRIKVCECVYFARVGPRKILVIIYYRKWSHSEKTER